MSYSPSESFANETRYCHIVTAPTVMDLVIGAARVAHIANRSDEAAAQELWCRQSRGRYDWSVWLPNSLLLCLHEH